MGHREDDCATPIPETLDGAWRAYHAGIETLRDALHAMPIVRTPFDHAAADRWLLQSQAAAHNLVMAPDPRNPRFLLHSVFEPNVFSWLLPNPDFLYRYAFLDGRETCRIEGLRRNAHFVDAQVIAGFWGDPDMKLLDAYAFDDLGSARDGRVDIHVGPDSPADGRPWIRTDPGSARNTLIVREAFYDWEKESPSRLRIAPAPGTRLERPAPDEAETARRIGAALRMIRFCHGTFSGGLTANVVASVGYNRFLLLDTSRDEDAANPVAGYVPIVFDIGADEALVLEFEIPRATYWGLQLGDLWWQAADYVDHQSSLNGSTGRRRPGRPRPRRRCGERSRRRQLARHDGTHPRHRPPSLVPRRSSSRSRSEADARVGGDRRASAGDDSSRRRHAPTSPGRPSRSGAQAL